MVILEKNYLKQLDIELINIYFITMTQIKWMNFIW
jgi:hypothetical protein